MPNILSSLALFIGFAAAVLSILFAMIIRYGDPDGLDENLAIVRLLRKKLRWTKESFEIRSELMQGSLTADVSLRELMLHLQDEISRQAKKSEGRDFDIFISHQMAIDNIDAKDLSDVERASNRMQSRYFLIDAKHSNAIAYEDKSDEAEYDQLTALEDTGRRAGGTREWIH